MPVVLAVDGVSIAQQLSKVAHKM